MNYLLIMTLSGSVMMLLYLLTKLLLKEKLSAKWSYRLIKAVTLYFLIPLPWLKSAYTALLEAVMSRIQMQEEAAVFSTFQGKSLMFFDGENYYVNQPLQIQLVLAGVWLFMVFVMILFGSRKYFQGRKQLKQCRGAREKEEDVLFIAQMRQKYKVNRRVRCYNHQEIDNKKVDAFTTGILHPVIVYSNISQDKKELILEHEMFHIKRLDIIWRMLAYCVWAIHWYNPLAWRLLTEMETASEKSCDEEIIRGKSYKEKQDYITLLINMAAGITEEDCCSLSLTKEGRILEERVKNMIQKKNNWGKVVSACVLGGAVLLNSLTVLAYEDVQYYHEEVQNEQELEDVLHTDHVFVSGTFEEAKDAGFCDITVEVLYDSQFVDAEGNIYPAQEQITTYATCSHSFVTGILQDHAKNSDGGCTVTYYNAQRCSKCALVVRGEEISTTTYKSCPH